MEQKDIYSIEKIQMKDWKVSLYSHWKNHLCDSKTFHKFLDEELVHFSDKHSYRIDIEIDGVQFLLAVFNQSKDIYVGSKNLSTEMAIIKYAQSFDINLEQLNSHLDKIASTNQEDTPLVIERVTSKHNLANFDDPLWEEVHLLANQYTDKLVKETRNYKSTFFEKLSDYALGLTANFALIRVHLLKFLAVLACLDHDKNGDEVKRILLESLRRLLSDNEAAIEVSAKGQNRPLPSLHILLLSFFHKVIRYIPSYPLALIIRFSVRYFAKRFIAGTDIRSAKQTLASLRSSGRDATLDQLGELVVSKDEADHYMNQVLELIEGMREQIEPGECNAAGIYRAHISIKVSALSHIFKPEAFDYTYQNVAPRLKRILLTARENKVFINIDAEHYSYRDLTLKIYEKLLLETEELKDYDQTGIVLQGYLRDAIEHLKDIVSLVEKRKLKMPIRLVKGAYWDAETIEAQAFNFNSPQYLNKDETDIHFRQLIVEILKNKYLQLTVASHNIQDHCFAMATREKLYPDAPVIEHQCLHMTYEALSIGLKNLGVPVRNYIPVGDLLVGMAYLVRRIMENSSQVGVLTIMRSHKKMMDLSTPSEKLKSKKEESLISFDDSLSNISSEFKNIYPLRPYIKKHFKLIEDSLKSYQSQLDHVDKSKSVPVICSSDPELVLGSVNFNTPKEVNEKIEKLFESYQHKAWKERPNLERIGKLYKFADLMLQKRTQLVSLIMYEAGKTMLEAIADVDEAIDFVHFYTREQSNLEALGNQAIGVVGVIAPWNFPLAIPCGMTVAALAAGNTVILKPAEQTQLIAIEMMKLLEEAGIDHTICDIALGEAQVGEAITSNELISKVVFTGSKQVGQLIYNKFSSQLTSERYGNKLMTKKAITEMGGKNAVIVTNNCELDETVSAILYSAFAHSGQKCSAASRIIIDNKIKEAFLTRFKQAVTDITVGKSYEFSTVINPLITAQDQNRVRESVKEACAEARQHQGVVHIDRSQEKHPGFCVGPVLIELPYKRALAQDSYAQIELFAPVVHIIGYDTFDQAIHLLNSTPYALTGGIFSQSQDDIDIFIESVECGNFYVNRSNTGARVAIEPFGGFKLSGTGPKAGSAIYLEEFNFKPYQLFTHSQSEKLLLDFKKDLIDEQANNVANLEFLSNSGLTYENRLIKTRNFISELILNFEFILSGVDESLKQQLNDVRDYLYNPNIWSPQKKYPNRLIPGQTNYNLRDIAVGETLHLAHLKGITECDLSYLCLNLLIGNGVCIVCSPEHKKAWEDIFQLLYQAGFSAFNYQLFSSHDITIDKLSQYPFKHVLYRGSQIDFEMRSKLFHSSKKDQFLKRFTDFELENQELINQDLRIFHLTQTKSLAINTMRHGAPLELDIHAENISL